MLIGALAIFTLVASMGLAMSCSVWHGRPVDAAYPRIHAIAALLGSALVIASALAGDTRLYANIAMAVIIILLGVLMAVTSRKGKPVPKVILLTHASLAVACYGLLAWFALVPGATLPIALG